MALGDVTIIGPAGEQLPPALRFRTQAGTTVINAGEPVKLSGNYAVPSADAEPVTASPTFMGIASSTSTQTASVDGVVDVLMALPGLVFSCSALSPAAIDTDAELLALLNSNVLFNLASGSYTVDTAVVAAGNGLKIVGGDIVTGKLSFIVRETCTALS